MAHITDITTSTFIRRMKTFTAPSGKTFKNVLQFNLDKRQVALSDEERAKLAKVFTWNRSSKYYYHSYKSEKAMNNAYEALLLTYGEYFNAAADNEVVSDAGKSAKKTKSSSAKTTKKSSSKKTSTKATKSSPKTSKPEPKTVETKVSTEPDVDDFLDLVKEEDRNEVIGYDFADVLKSQALAINKLIEQFCDMRAQTDARLNRLEKMLAKASK